MDDIETSRGRQPLPDYARAPGLHAGFWLRVGAYLIDGFILAPVLTVLWLFTLAPGVFHTQQDAAPFVVAGVLLFWLALILVPWLYHAVCESSKWQATPGKLALGLRVTDEYGQRIGFARASGRHFGKIISGAIMDIGYMMAGFTARKQTLHDMMAGCCVVRKDGLAQFKEGRLPAAEAGAPVAGMPGWAIGLIVAAVAFFMVVPILAILAAIAIPAYQNYLVRAQVDQGVVLAATAEKAVATYITGNGAMPRDNAAAGLPDPDAIHGDYVSAVTIQDGQVVVEFGGRANRMIRGAHIVLAPNGSGATMDWQCSSPDIKPSLLPARCRGDAGGETAPP